MLVKGQIDRYSFTYRLEGNSCHPAILFLHGFMGDRDDFNDIIATLSNQFYCVALDLPAHRDSQAINLDNGEPLIFANHLSKQFLEQYHTIQAYAHLVVNFLDLIHLKSCTMLGYSMGGRLALYIAVHCPAYIDRLILESASPGIADAQARRDRLLQDQQLADILENLPLEKFPEFLQQWYQQPIFGNLRSHPHFTQMLQRRLMHHPKALAQCLRSLSTGLQPSLWHRLPQLNIPVLLIAGKLDHKFMQIHQAIGQQIKSADIATIPNCGHNTHFEQPQTFTTILKRWLIPTEEMATPFLH
jgi:2-succinyl-6-hydroxy-2,4-cyclohexadiene-1-carboxylate synthase